VRVAEILRQAIVRNCPHIIVAHNHPSGDPTPSNPEDYEVTKQLVEAAKLLDLELLDHLVIGHQRYISLKAQMGWK
jgi:DNA repair protein RadC